MVGFLAYVSCLSWQFRVPFAGIIFPLGCFLFFFCLSFFSRLHVGVALGCFAVEAMLIFIRSTKLMESNRRERSILPTRFYRPRTFNRSICFRQLLPRFRFKDNFVEGLLQNLSVNLFLWHRDIAMLL